MPNSQICEVSSLFPNPYSINTQLDDLLYLRRYTECAGTKIYKMRSTDIQNAKREFDRKLFTFSFGEHKDKKVIWVSFPYDAGLILMLRQYVKAYWSASHKSW